MGPIHWAPHQALGAPSHPHRGFETVTYLLKGEMTHLDSVKNSGTLGPGDVQWMTAGSGIIHSELPSEGFQAQGGEMHGFQLWVNLPRSHKMTAPRYQDIPAKDIVEFEDNGYKVRLLAGELNGRKSPTKTILPITYAHIATHEPGSFLIEGPLGKTTLIYVFKDEITVGNTPISAGTLAQLNQKGTLIELSQNLPTQCAELLLLAGDPLHEPMVQAGPFVMNTKEELLAAFREMENGSLVKT